MRGQILERGEGKWLVRVFLGRQADGKKRYHSKVVNGSKKDAQKYLTKKLAEVDNDTFIAPRKERLSEYLDRWLDTVVRNRVAKKTFQSYTDIATMYIKPHLGRRELSSISSQDINVMYSTLLKKGLSPRTVRYAHAVLHSALSQAVKWKVLPRNEATLVDLPKHHKVEMKVLTEEQARRFLEQAAISPWHAFFTLLLVTGMRPNEALGLRWSDIDFEKGRIHVQRALTRGKSGWALEEPKTSRSRRSIPVPEPLVDLLHVHRAEQDVLRSNTVGFANHGLVFTNAIGEPPDYRNIFVRHFKHILETAGLPKIRMYDLRHTCATLLLSAGENPKIVSERLGHASITLTLDTYSHVLPHMQEGASSKLGKMLFPVSEGPEMG